MPRFKVAWGNFYAWKLMLDTWDLSVAENDHACPEALVWGLMSFLRVFFLAIRQIRLLMHDV